MSYIKKYLQPYTLTILFALLCLSLETAMDLLQPALLQRMVDQGIAHKDLSQIMIIGSMMVSCVFLGAIFAWGRNLFSAKVTFSFGADLRLALFEKIQSFTLREISPFPRASLITRLTNDVTQIQGLIGGMMRIYLKAPLTIIGSIILASRISPKLSIFIYGALPLSFLFFFFNVRFLYPKYGHLQQSLDQLNGKIREFLSGIGVIFIFNAFSQESSSFEKINENLRKAATSSMSFAALITPWVSILLHASLGLILYYSAELYATGKISVGEIMAFINYMTQIIIRTGMLSGIFNVFARSKASYKRLDDILSLPLASDPPSKLFSTEGSLVLDGVSFTYPGASQWTLKDITFRCTPGESIGIIGATGSGKTTLAHLILSLYSPSQGEIRLGSTPLDQLSQEQRGRLMAYAPQKNILFSGTIASNLLFSGKEVTPAEMWSALEEAHADDFVKALDLGLFAPVDAEGQNFSGGQRQRLSLARSFLKDAPILLLDDSLSKLDSHTELSVRRSLKTKSKDRILLLIAQKISSVMDCTRILVLDKGRIVGHDTHENLLATCTKYQEIYYSQFGH